jgi:hypothetical protein
LEVDALLRHEPFERRGGFVVQFLQAGFEAAVDEMLVQLGVGSKVFLLSAVFHSFDQNGVAVEIVQDKEILVALARLVWETTCLVGEDLAGWVDDGGVDAVSSRRSFEARWRCIGCWLGALG